MMRTGLLFGALALTFLGGCGGGVREENIQVKAPSDPLDEPRGILKRYGEGQALGSEAANFPQMVEQARKADAARADQLQQAFAEIQKAPAANRAALAKSWYKKLEPPAK